MCEGDATRGGKAGSSRVSAWKGRGGDFSMMATPLRDAPGEIKASEL